LAILNPVGVTRAKLEERKTPQRSCEVFLLAGRQELALVRTDNEKTVMQPQAAGVFRSNELYRDSNQDLSAAGGLILWESH